jgi:hypothetical protein
MMSLRRMSAGLLALAAGAGWPQQPALVQLHHRSAESLVTVLQPLVAPATLAGTGAQLQVRASPSDLPRVMQLIEQSDRPPRPLDVVFSDQAPAIGRVAGDLGDAQPPARAGSITLSTGGRMAPDPYGNGQILSTRPERRSSRIMEGEPLRIAMPATQSLWFGRRAGRSKQKAPAGSPDAGVSAPVDVAGVASFDGVSDFTARIWVADTTVAIELKPLSAAGGIDAGSDAASAATTVYGRVGEWIALADTGTDLQNPSQGSGPARTGLWIKVDSAGSVGSR